jgi:gas vesicle protein
MERGNQMEDNKVSYFLLGLGMGVAVGVLFAPKSGEETREMLKGKANEGRDYLRRRTEEVRDSANEVISRGRETLQQQRDNLAAALEAGKQAYRQSVDTEAARGGEGA